MYIAKQHKSQHYLWSNKVELKFKTNVLQYKTRFAILSSKSFSESLFLILPLKDWKHYGIETEKVLWEEWIQPSVAWALPWEQLEGHPTGQGNTVGQ